MGTKDVRVLRTAAERRQFTDLVLRDLRAFEKLLRDNAFETEPLHCGVEQEMFLVTDDGEPAPVATELLDLIEDPRHVSEIARFNLEANVDPQRLRGGFLAAIEADLHEVVGIADRAAQQYGARVVLVGSLPTLRRKHLTPEYRMPELRYQALDEAILYERGSNLQVHIEGWERYEATHQSVMVEAANTSFQLHLQVHPEEFAQIYNWVQLFSAPLLAVACNSPLFCGRRLWHESRVAVFEAATDARSEGERTQGAMPRVSLGADWLPDGHQGALDFFRDNLARYRPLLGSLTAEDPAEAMAEGRAPKLEALSLHSGTVWRWNRACYGGGGARPHLRIENRVLPAGPSVIDEMANAALFYGLCAEVGRREFPRHQLAFAQARRNFTSAARYGLDAQVHWPEDGGGSSVYPVHRLIRDHLLPAAERGLERLAVPADQIDRYLGVIGARVEQRRSPSSWLLDAVGGTDLSRDVSGLATATQVLVENQQSGRPVHDWPAPNFHRSLGDLRVQELMVRDVFTVRADTSVALAESLMQWRHVRHVPVVDETGVVVGLLSARALAQRISDDGGEVESVAELMGPPPPALPPEAHLAQVLDLFLDKPTGCVIVSDEESPLLGILTERDFLEPLRRHLAASS